MIPEHLLLRHGLVAVKEEQTLKLGAEAFSKKPVSNLKLVINHQDTIPKRKRWNPRKLIENLTVPAIVAIIAMVLVRMIWYR